MHARACTYPYILLPVVILLAVGGVTNVHGQATGDPREDFLYGEYYISMGQFQKALPFFQSALQHNPDNANVNYRVGFCLLKTVGRQTDAIPYLQKAVTEINDRYVAGKYKATGAPPESWLLLGEAYHRDNQLHEASCAYHTYKEMVADSDKKMLEVVMQRISGLGISYEFQREEQVAELVNLGATINSRFSDYNPVLSGDQSTLIYTQYWESYDRIMITRKTNGEWELPREITDEVGSEGNCYTTALSYDGSELYLVKYDQMDFDIFVSYHRDGQWLPMQELGGKVNGRFRETSATISGDGSTLYFASDRPGGEGGFDLYRAMRQGNEWVEVSNLGVAVNTDKNEEAPCISSDGTLLFFSSNGHETIGNLDVLFTELDASGYWSRPQNVGSPINTTSDDLFYTYFKDTKSGYFSRDFPDGYGKNDIYMLKGVKRYVAPKDDEEVFQRQSLGQTKVSDSQVVDDPTIIFYTQSPTRDTVLEPADESIAQNMIEGNNSTVSKWPEEEPDHSVPTIVTTAEKNASLDGSRKTYSAEQRVGNDKSKDFVVKDNVSDSELHALNKEDITVLEENYTPSFKDEVYSDSIPTYTIQVYALEKPVSLNRIALGTVCVSPGSDGLHRYTFGEYEGWSKAMELLDSIKSLGYPDAFIRNVSTVSNYSGMKH